MSNHDSYSDLRSGQVVLRTARLSFCKKELQSNGERGEVAASHEKAKRRDSRVSGLVQRRQRIAIRCRLKRSVSRVAQRQLMAESAS
jgi:hypothetical protein